MISSRSQISHAWMKKAQDRAPTYMKKGEALEIVKKSLRGTEYEDTIEFWDETPIGVASIGAVSMSG